MPDPVTTAAGASTAKDVAGTVVNETGSFFGNLLSSPFSFLKGVFKGGFSGLTNIFGTLVTSGIIAGVARFAPDFVTWIPFKIGGKKVGDILIDDAREGGTPALLKDSLLAGLAINTGLGALKGGLSGAMGSTESTTTGGKIGGFIGASAVTVGAVMLAAGALKKSDSGVDFSGAADHSGSKQPTPTPATPGNTAAQPQK